MTASGPAGVDPAASAPIEREFSIPRGWLAAGYVALFVLLAKVFPLGWHELSPIQTVVHFDGRAPRWMLVHHDTSATKIEASSELGGIRLRATGLRAGGAGLVVRAPVLVAELPCPPGTPHVHSQISGPEELVIELEAKREGPPSSLLVSTGGGMQFRYAEPVELSTEWKSIRLRVAEMSPGISSFPELADDFAQVVVSFLPATDVDAWVRDLRIVRAPRAPAARATPSP